MTMSTTTTTATKKGKLKFNYTIIELKMYVDS